MNLLKKTTDRLLKDLPDDLLAYVAAGGELELVHDTKSRGIDMTVSIRSKDKFAVFRPKEGGVEVGIERNGKTEFITLQKKEGNCPLSF